METIQKIKTSPKDFFLQLGAIVALYISVVSLLTLLLGIIDQLFPRPFAYTDPYAGGVSLAMAMIFTAFPLYFVFMRIILRDEDTQPEKRELSIRKWLTYITIFVAGLAMAIDLIVLLQKFFAGEEITLAFALKVVSFIVVLATVFGYYIYDARHSLSEVSAVRPRFGYIAICFVLLAIMIGFGVMGSPYSQKEKRFDAERVSHLQMIQSQVISYWQAKQKLPNTLEDIKNPISGFVLPVDPSNQTQYEYFTKGNFSFSLCATFSKETPANSGLRENLSPEYQYKGGINENWQHGVGRVCFERTIDPELYPPLAAAVKLVPSIREVSPL